MMEVSSHSHPCSFRLHRYRDRGWGELAFEYRWDSTSGHKDEEGVGNPDLAHCYLYEITSYAGNLGIWAEDYFVPCCPPFLDWRFRDPTDGRTGPVGLECFPATQGWAWDRHKLGGKLVLPLMNIGLYSIAAVQRYCFHCTLCGLDQMVPGPAAGPHLVLRTFELKDAGEERKSSTLSASPVWRYSLKKHGVSAWMDLDSRGYVADSAGIGFGPW